MRYSIIVPVYNRPDEVNELLESLTRQEEKDFEVVIVEDGSKTPCQKVCDQYAGRLDLHYFMKPNSGPGQSRNYGAERAKGDYLLILDSDVVLPEGYLTAISKELDREPADAFGGPDCAHSSFTPTQKAISYSMTSFFTTGGIRGGKKKLILGGKMQEEEINQIVRSAMMLDEDITYLDYVTHDKKHELYASMSAFVFPSKAEGFGMPIIEVMRFKKPIIASNLPIFDEITDGNINTFNIRCNEYEQINNLADELLSYNTEVDTEAYANVVKRYAPDRLGKVVYDFITSD